MSRSVAISERLVRRWLQAAPLVVAVACGGPQSLGSAGAKCFRDDECEAGLICVAPMESDINRVCSDDPTPLISNVDGPPPLEPQGGGAGEAGATAGANVGAMAGGGMGAMASGGMGANAGIGANAGTGASAGSGGTDTAGSGGSAGGGGTDTAGSGGSAGSGGTGGTDPEGGAPN